MTLPTFDDISNEIVTATEDLLSVRDVAPTDDFLALGGGSLTAARLMLRLGGRFDIDLSEHLVLIFDTQSLAELATEILKLLSEREAHVSKAAGL